jgi:hypothetical protein
MPIESTSSTSGHLHVRRGMGTMLGDMLGRMVGGTLGRMLGRMLAVPPGGRALGRGSSASAIVTETGIVEVGHRSVKDHVTQREGRATHAAWR